MAPARSIQCIKRPPSSAPSGLASLGRTISAISDCESLTGRGSSPSSLILIFPFQWPAAVDLACGLRHFPSLPLFDVGLKETFGHALHSFVVMEFLPLRRDWIELQHPMLRGTMTALAYVANVNTSGGRVFAAH